MGANKGRKDTQDLTPLERKKAGGAIGGVISGKVRRGEIPRGGSKSGTPVPPPETVSMTEDTRIGEAMVRPSLTFNDDGSTVRTLIDIEGNPMDVRLTRDEVTYRDDNIWGLIESGVEALLPTLNDERFGSNIGLTDAQAAVHLELFATIFPQLMDATGLLRGPSKASNIVSKTNYKKMLLQIKAKVEKALKEVPARIETGTEPIKQDALTADLLTIPATAGTIPVADHVAILQLHQASLGHSAEIIRRELSAYRQIIFSMGKQVQNNLQTTQAILQYLRRLFNAQGAKKEGEASDTVMPDADNPVASVEKQASVVSSAVFYKLPHFIITAAMKAHLCRCSVCDPRFLEAHKETIFLSLKDELAKLEIEAREEIAKNVKGSESLARRGEENLLKASVASTDIKNKANQEARELLDRAKASMTETEANCHDLVKQAEKGADEILQQSRSQAKAILSNAKDDATREMERITSTEARNQMVNEYKNTLIMNKDAVFAAALKDSEARIHKDIYEKGFTDAVNHREKELKVAAEEEWLRDLEDTRRRRRATEGFEKRVEDTNMD